MERDTDFLGGVFKIALGIVLGGAVLWFGVSRYEAYQVQKALIEVSGQLQAESDALHKAQLRRDADAWAERELGAVKAEQRRLESLESQREANRWAAVNADQEARQLREKEQAWAKFYSQPERCRVPADFGVNVECGNLYIRAKREFEARWSRDHR